MTFKTIHKFGLKFVNFKYFPEVHHSPTAIKVPLNCTSLFPYLECAALLGPLVTPLPSAQGFPSSGAVLCPMHPNPMSLLVLLGSAPCCLCSLGAQYTPSAYYIVSKNNIYLCIPSAYCYSWHIVSGGIYCITQKCFSVCVLKA